MSARPEDLHETIAAYNEAWNAHDVERIASMHAPDMVFENHTAGERAEGAEALAHIAGIFESWPDIEFQTRRLHVREDLVVQEWTATATHVKPLSRGDIVRELRVPKHVLRSIVEGAAALLRSTSPACARRRRCSPRLRRRTPPRRRGGV